MQSVKRLKSHRGTLKFSAMLSQESLDSVSVGARFGKLSISARLVPLRLLQSSSRLVQSASLDLHSSLQVTTSCSSFGHRLAQFVVLHRQVGRSFLRLGEADLTVTQLVPKLQGSGLRLSLPA